MTALLRQLSLYAPLRRRRQPQFFARHAVVGAGAIATLIAFWIIVEAPSTQLPLTIWLCLGWLSGIVIFAGRELPRLLPKPLRFLHKRWIVWVYGLLGIVGAIALTVWIRPLPEYSAFFRADALWVFYLPPLLYVARYGEWRTFQRLLIFAALSYALLGLILDFELHAILTTCFLTALLGMLAYGAHQTIESIRMQTKRVHTLHLLTQTISNPHELGVSYDNFAKTISGDLKYPVVHVMLWDANENALIVGGAHGKPTATSKTIRVSSGEGLVGRCFVSKSYVVCNDVRGFDGRDKGYMPRPGYEDIQSELVVPLTYGREQLGVLDFQSYQRNEFDKDIAEAHILARAISMAIKWNESTHTQTLLWDTITRAQSSKDLDTLINEILDLVRQHLGAALLTFYPLIPETALPRRAKPYRRGKLLADETTKGLDSFEPGARVYELVCSWQAHFAKDAEHDRALRGDKPRLDDFIGREKIKSVVFLPLGASDYKLGVLLINYRDPREFSPAVQAQMRAFGAAFTLAIRILHERARAAYVARTGVHRNLTRYLYPVNMQLNQVRASVANRDLARLDQHLLELQGAILQMRGRIARDAEGIFSEPAVGLYDALHNAVSSLRPENPPTFSAQVSPQVEALSPLLHAVLYDWAVEAMANAVGHGHANSLHVTANLALTRRHVICQIIDDGAQFDPERVRHSNDGIFALARWLDQELNAKTEFVPNEEEGMCLRVTIPILPVRGGSQ